MNHLSKRLVWIACFVICGMIANEAVASKLTFQVNDAKGSPVPCRIHLQDAAGQPVQPPGLPFWKDHFVCNGRVDLSVPSGSYSYEIERGPEHERLVGKIEVTDARDETVTAKLARIADLKSLGWYGGETHVHRAMQDVPLLMQAEDLHVAQVITWWNKRNPWTSSLPDEPLRRADQDRFFHVLAGEDERGGGALLYFHLNRPLEITKAEREIPSSLSFLKEAREAQPTVWVDIEKPFWWDVPMWLASGKVDSIGIANNHMCRSQMYPNEAWGKPRDMKRYPDPHGNGYWTQDIYYHILNSGLRVPPSAGSASGVLPNPVGYNRVYVQTGEQLDYETWWKNLKAGRSFVTNGPLLLVRADDKLPGEVFSLKTAGSISMDIQLTSLDRVPRIEIVQNGTVVQTIDCADKREQRLTTKLQIEKSGWFLVRAITDTSNTFRFASTAPFYVEVGDVKSSVSRKSCKFFQKWSQERARSVGGIELVFKPEGQAVRADHDSAIAFWALRARDANSE